MFIVRIMLSNYELNYLIVQFSEVESHVNKKHISAF